MAISQQNQVQIENVAGEALNTFAKVADAARSVLDSSTQGVRDYGMFDRAQAPSDSRKAHAQ